MSCIFLYGSHNLLNLQLFLVQCSYIVLNRLSWIYFFIFVEEAAADEKRGKLYKPKSRFEGQTKSILPLETPPQFLSFERKQVCLPKSVISFFFLLLFAHIMYLFVF